MKQPSLFEDTETAVEEALVCAFGEPWMGDHPLCRAETERGCQAFAEAVARGDYDEEGYTPNERKMQARRRREREQEGQST